VAAPAGSPVAIFIDLVPTDPRGDAFGAHLTRHPDCYAAILRLLPAQRSRLVPAAGAAIVTELTQRIRACAAEAGTHRVHLFLRTPFPVAVLLGRALNTLEVTLYEWEDSSDPPSYIQTATVASGRGGGPVISA
jgi:SMODS-associated and fused to various effectors sensor domain